MEDGLLFLTVPIGGCGIPLVTMETTCSYRSRCGGMELAPSLWHPAPPPAGVWVEGGGESGLEPGPAYQPSPIHSAV